MNKEKKCNKEEKELLNVIDITKLTNRHSCTVYRWIKKGKFPAPSDVITKKVEGVYSPSNKPRKYSFKVQERFWKKEDVEKWLADNKDKINEE